MRARLILLFLILAAGCTSSTSPGDGGTDAGGDASGPAVCASDADCDDGLFCNGPETCDPADGAAGADGCVAGESPCADGCDEASDTCDGSCADADGDGVEDAACGGSDCDDDDANRFPGNPEVCDAEDHDEDCDDSTYGEVDEDMDGVDDARCCNVDRFGASTCGRDCDDSESNVSPLAPEVCNGVDDDCDGQHRRRVSS